MNKNVFDKKQREFISKTCVIAIRHINSNHHGSKAQNMIEGALLLRDRLTEAIGEGGFFEQHLKEGGK